MWKPYPVIGLELSNPPPALSEVTARKVLALLRWNGAPIAWHELSVSGTTIDWVQARKRIRDAHGSKVAEEIVRQQLAGPASTCSLPAVALPTVSVVVCTRDRPDDMRRCLAALASLDPAPAEIIVVDNAPTTDGTARACAEFEGVRYVLEPRPGLDWARNRGILEATSEVLAFTDDDAAVDTNWVGVIQQCMAVEPELGLMTGLVAPMEMETEWQEAFETYGGFGRGFERRWVHHPFNGKALPWHVTGTGAFGTGANMAVRRSVFDEIGLFAPELDTGTPTQGGGDLEIFFRIIKCGYPMLYEPRMLVWHRHRADQAGLLKQIRSWGVGFQSHLEHVHNMFPEEGESIAQMRRYWRKYLAKKMLREYVLPNSAQRKLRTAEFIGAFQGAGAYRKAIESTQAIASKYGPLSNGGSTPRPLAYNAGASGAIAVRPVELTALSSVADVADYRDTKVFFACESLVFADVSFCNHGGPLSPQRLADGLLAKLGFQAVAAKLGDCSLEIAQARLLVQFESQLFSGQHSQRVATAFSPSVSVVLATCDRTEQLKRCLDSLYRVNYAGPIEVIVVDNKPSSVRESGVLDAFPKTRLVEEPRRGLSFARNAGFVVATGEVIVCTDDDVMFDLEWLTNLVQPLRRNDVDMVCGNVLPMSLDAAPQRAFEDYGGLGKGYTARQFDATWFRRSVYAAPTWTIGATANTAFRASLLHDPDVGLFDETLGPGVPSGVGEDTYFYYRALRAGYTICYEPSSLVWHEHRSTEQALHSQLRNYSSGHVAYHLRTLVSDGDIRAIERLANLAAAQGRRMAKIGANVLLKRQPKAALDRILVEVTGNMSGPMAFARSVRNLRQIGKTLRPSNWT
jgi:O-antigen biosynthesis protein